MWSVAYTLVQLSQRTRFSFSLVVWLLLSLAEAEFENIYKCCWELLFGHAQCAWAEYLVLQMCVVIHNYNLCKLQGFCSCVAEHSILGFDTSGSVISQKKEILYYNLVYWEKGNLGELDLNVVHCLRVLSLFIKIQLNTLGYIHFVIVYYSISDMFWLISSHQEGKKYEGTCTSLQIAWYMCLVHMM